MAELPSSHYAKLRVFPYMMCDHYSVTYADALINLALQAGVEDPEQYVHFGCMARVREFCWWHGNPSLAYLREAVALRKAAEEAEAAGEAGASAKENTSPQVPAGAGPVAMPQ